MRGTVSGFLLEIVSPTEAVLEADGRLEIGSMKSALPFCAALALDVEEELVEASLPFTLTCTAGLPFKERNGR